MVDVPSPVLVSLAAATFFPEASGSKTVSFDASDHPLPPFENFDERLVAELLAEPRSSTNRGNSTPNWASVQVLPTTKPAARSIVGIFPQIIDRRERRLGISSFFKTYCGIKALPIAVQSIATSSAQLELLGSVDTGLRLMALTLR